MKLSFLRIKDLKTFGKKSAILILSGLCFMSSLTLAGCQSKSSEKQSYDLKTEAYSVSSCVLASNENFELSWNDETKAVLLRDLKTGKIWSNIPYEYQLEGGTSANLNSTLNITVSSQKSMEWSTLRGYTEVNEKGRLFSEKIQNGIKITYCFDKYEISIPVEYTLREDSVKISVNPNEIIEGGGKYILVSAEIAPFMCAALNADNNSYFLIPSGSGALMYAKEHLDGEKMWSGEVYGEDPSRATPRSLTNEEPVRMPIFGVKDGEASMLTVIEENAGGTVINSMVGNPRTGYSNIYPTVYFRGYDVFSQDNKGDLKRVSGELSGASVAIGYYPLEKGAGVSEMADKYREYLKENKLLDKSDISDSPYSLTLLGGVVTTTSFLGIPKKELNAMTTFKEAEQIIKASEELTGISPKVRLMSFGDGGINIGKLGGGFDFPSVYGGKKERESLIAYLNTEKISCFFDFDLLRFTKSSNGFSYINDAAKTAIFKRAEQYAQKGVFRTFDKDSSYRFIKRALLPDAIDRTVESAEKFGFAGIGLSSLTSTAYSDYSDRGRYVKGGIEREVSGYITEVKKAGYKAAGAAANYYAAGLLDVIFDAPADNGLYDNLDESLPFYQMVYRGKIPLYTTAVNLTANPDKAIMQAATCGMGLGFTVIGSYDVAYDEAQADKLYGMLFDDNTELIKNSVDNYRELYDSVSGALIKSYKINQNGTTETYFDNGVTVYANHTNQERETEAGVLKAYGYLGVRR